MSIHFVTGRPGAGKSFYSMKLILEELRGTDRKIVTNLAVLPDELAEMLHTKFGETFNLLERLHLITDEEIEFFYCHRGLSTGALQVDYNDKGKAQKFDIETAQSTGGVFYILDEVHLAFGARNWQAMGNACIYYASQHRKLGDDVILITQAPKMVDTTFRNLAQDYTVLRNHAMEKILFFKQPKFFSRQTFLNLPTANETPMEKSMFRLDMNVAKCYDTSQGVGIHTRGEADTKGDRRKGLPWWVAVIAFLGLIYVGSQIPNACGRFVADEVMEFGDDIQGLGVIDANSSFMPTLPETTTNTPTKTVVNISTNSVQEELEVEVQMVTGWLTRGNPLDESFEFVGILSNGTKLSLQGGDIVSITRSHVVDKSGKVYEFERTGPDMQSLIDRRTD